MNFVGSIVGSNAALILVTGACLTQLWIMLNSMQVTVHAPLFANVLFPAKAMMFVQALLQIATFSLINTKDWID